MAHQVVSSRLAVRDNSRVAYHRQPINNRFQLVAGSYELSGNLLKVMVDSRGWLSTSAEPRRRHYLDLPNFGQIYIEVVNFLDSELSFTINLASLLSHASNDRRHLTAACRLLPNGNIAALKSAKEADFRINVGIA